MAEAKFSVGTVNITNYLRITAKETRNLTSLVANIVYAPPHPTTRNIDISDLNPVPHQFDFYESPDGVALGELLATYVIDVGKIYQASITVYEFTVGGPNEHDPEAGDTEWNFPLLAGYDSEHLAVSQRGIGYRSFMDEIEAIDTGGFRFQGGETFNNGDRWFVLALNLVTTTTQVVSKGIYTDVVTFTAGFTIDNTYYNKLMEANGATSSILTVTFGVLADIPDDTIFGFNTHIGSQRYIAIQLHAGDYCRFMGEAKNIFWLGKGEEIMLVKKGSLLKVMQYDGDYRRVGEKSKADLQPMNSLPETGGWKLFADYPRFYYEFVNKIPSLQLSAGGNAGTNTPPTERTKFAVDVVNVSFWMPDTGGYFERNVDPNNDVDTERTQKYSGSSQTEALKSHTHAYTERHAESYTGGPTSSISGGGANNPADFAKVTAAFGGAETRPVNVAINSWRII